MTIEDITECVVRAYKASPPSWDYRRWGADGREIPTEPPPWKTAKNTVKICPHR